jgi:ankyrin repeat protein
LNEIGPNGWVPLHLAAIGGHRSLSEYLLNEGADISIKDKSGRSAAKLAEIFGHEGLAKFLRNEEKARKTKVR